uniref:Uncharacterized protein n=1 Tax=Caenorhabditis tropicalis TaxID=1561998 RepID=A0A1I7UN03_9PELO
MSQSSSPEPDPIPTGNTLLTNISPCDALTQFLRNCTQTSNVQTGTALLATHQAAVSEARPDIADAMSNFKNPIAPIPTGFFDSSKA